MSQDPRRPLKVSAIVARSLVTLALCLVVVGCSSSRVSQTAPAPSGDQPEPRLGEPQVLPVVSAAAGLFVVTGPGTRRTDELPARREYIGHDAELMIASRSGAVTSLRYTLVSDERHCVAVARGPVSLWIARRDSAEQLTEPVDAVALEGCGELEFGEWLVAVDGDRDEVAWRQPVYEASFEGAGEVSSVVSSLRGDLGVDLDDEATHLARFDLGGTSLSALAVSTAPLDGRLPRPSASCEHRSRVTVSLVQASQVVATFDAGERLGVLEVGETNFVVHLSTSRRVLTAWHVDEHGLALAATSARPTYSELDGC